MCHDAKLAVSLNASKKKKIGGSEMAIHRAKHSTTRTTTPPTTTKTVKQPSLQSLDHWRWTNPNTMIPTVIDRFSKARKLSTAMEAAQMTFKEVFMFYGLPADIVSDQRVHVM